MGIIIGLAILAAILWLLYKVLTNHTIRWIFAVVGMLAFIGWVAHSCNSHRHANVTPAALDRVAYGVVE